MTMDDQGGRSGGIIRITVDASRGIDETWRLVGGFVDSGKFSDVTSVLESGGGGLGSIRRVENAVVEKMVALGRHFYVYHQIVGPMADLGYHGCLAVQADGADHSVLVYTVLYEERKLEPARREGERSRLTRRFQDRLLAMSHYVAAAPRSRRPTPEQR
jgi:hypothetical protein